MINRQKRGRYQPCCGCKDQKAGSFGGRGPPSTVAGILNFRAQDGFTARAGRDHLSTGGAIRTIRAVDQAYRLWTTAGLVTERPGFDLNDMRGLGLPPSMFSLSKGRRRPCDRILDRLGGEIHAPS